MKLLALDTATELSSAALWLDGALSAREQLRSRDHGELILLMIGELLLQAGVSLPQLDAIAFGRGPGGFTGVRMAASVAQGLAFAAGLPLLPISDLRALAAQAVAEQGAGECLLVCQDARMQEVYWGCFERHGQALRPLGPERVSAPSALTLPGDWLEREVWAVGSGFAAYPGLRARLAPGLREVGGPLFPRAREIAQLAAQDGLQAALAPEQALPSYLRDDVATAPSPN